MQYVEQDKEPAVLDPMMDVHQKLLYVQSGDIVSVPHTNLEILNVVLVLMEVEEAAEVEVVVEASPKLEEGEVGQAREDILKEVEEAVAGVAVEVVYLVVEALLVEEVEGGWFFYFTILNNCRT